MFNTTVVDCLMFNTTVVECLMFNTTVVECLMFNTTVVECSSRDDFFQETLNDLTFIRSSFSVTPYSVGVDTQVQQNMTF